nr:ABC transporter permease subunit [Angustibacter aerolatus]
MAFLGPALLLLTIGLVYPALRTIFESLKDGQGTSFVGLDNYVTIFTNSDQAIVIRNTAMWVVLVPLFATGFGLLYAILVDRTRIEALAKGLVFLPMAISLVGASIIWKFMYDYRPETRPQIGLLNGIMAKPGRGHPPVPARRPAEHDLPHRRHGLDPGRLRDDRALGRDQGHPGRHHRGRAPRRRAGLRHVPLHHAAEHPRLGRGRRDHDRHRRPEGLRHRPHHDRWAVQDQRRGERVLQPDVPVRQPGPRRRARGRAVPAGRPDHHLQRQAGCDGRRTDEHRDQPRRRRDRRAARAEELDQHLRAGPQDAVVALRLAGRHHHRGAVDDPDLRALRHLVPPRAGDQPLGLVARLHRPDVDAGQLQDGAHRRVAAAGAVLREQRGHHAAGGAAADPAGLPRGVRLRLDGLPRQERAVRRGVRAAGRAAAGGPGAAAEPVHDQAHIGGTYWTVWLSHTMFALPLAIFLMHNFIKEIPGELIEAARVDGAGHVRIFFRIMLPLLTPALASFGIFQFLWVWNDLLVSLVFIGGNPDVAPLTVQIANLAGTRGSAWYLLSAGAFISIIVPLAVFLGLQRFFVRGLLAGGLKG